MANILLKRLVTIAWIKNERYTYKFSMINSKPV